MASFLGQTSRLIRNTPVRTFVLYPLLTLAWELVWNAGTLHLNLPFLPLMIWGYLQYRLCGLYRSQRGGGGPGFGKPPEQLVTTGPYTYTRNPMYLGHLIFLAGLTLTLRSIFAGMITVATAVWFHSRVLQDELRLRTLFGQPYIDYMARVKRWIPGLF